MGLDIPDYVTVRSRERPGQFREEIIKRFVMKKTFILKNCGFLGCKKEANMYVNSSVF